MYGCETWSLILKGEHKLGMFEKRVLRTVSGAKRDKMSGRYRKLRTDELHNSYASANTSIIKMIKSRRR
jgi:hypothetical protein